MIYTKEEFKRIWELPEDTEGGITMEDISDCAKAWGLYDRPKTCNISEVVKSVIKASGAIF